MVYIPLDKILASVGLLIGLILIWVDFYYVRQLYFSRLLAMNIGYREFSYLDINWRFYIPAIIGACYCIGSVLLFFKSKIGLYINVLTAFVVIILIMYRSFEISKISDPLFWVLMFFILGINSLQLLLLKREIRNTYKLGF